MTAAGSLRAFLTALPPVRTPIELGGSSAVLQQFTFGGLDYVVKYVEPSPHVVDGHDALSLAATIDQLALIRERCPSIAHRYAQPVAAYRGDDGAAIIMRRFPGVPLSTLDDPLPAIRFVLAELIPHGYLTQRVPAPAGVFSRLHLERVERRMSLVRRHLPARVRARLVVDAEPVPSVTALFERIRGDARLLAALDPPWLFTPAHGDLSLANILVAAGGAENGYVLLDPRGGVAPWDAVYDLAKVLWSLSGYDAAMRHGFAIARHGDGDGWTVRVRDGQTAALERAAGEFPAMLCGLPGFDELVDGDRHWRRRLHFAVAMHCLAEAACRLSDRKPRTFVSGAGYAARLELATGLHLMGRILLTRLLDLPDGELVRAMSWTRPC